MATATRLPVLRERVGVITYAVGPDGHGLVLSDHVLEVFARHRQVGRADPEAGGQLFGRFDETGPIEVLEATGPRLRDHCGRHTFRPDRKAEQLEIERMHARGRHYVGDWHTHPEEAPKASALDLRSIGETARLSRNTRGPLALVVVGTSPPPKGLFVGLHDGNSFRQLLPVLATRTP